MFAYTLPAKSNLRSESPLTVAVIAVAAVNRTVPFPVPLVWPKLNVAPASVLKLRSAPEATPGSAGPWRWPLFTFDVSPVKARS
ncbi:MAG: hypothetical protein ABIR92_02250 [Gemmatimonadaceae bacterium]